MHIEVQLIYILRCRGAMEVGWRCGGVMRCNYHKEHEPIQTVRV